MIYLILLQCNYRKAAMKFKFHTNDLVAPKEKDSPRSLNGKNIVTSVDINSIKKQSGICYSE